MLGETARITGSSSSASTSRSVKAGEVSRVPGPIIRLPGRRISTLVPRLATLAETCADEPCPTVTMAMTAATPITTPSTVRNERSLFRTMAMKARRIVSHSISGPRLHRLVPREMAVGEDDEPPGIGRDILFVGDHDDGDPFAVQRLHQLHDLMRPLAVEVACGLVGKDHRGFARQRAGDGHPLLLAARELRGIVMLAPGKPHPRQRPLRLLDPLGPRQAP